MDGFLSINEAAEKYIEDSQSKIQANWFKTLIKAIMAGAMISFGAAISSVAAHSITNVGLARLSAAVVFPVGLMMVIVFGAELFTGDCLVAMSVFGKRVKLSGFIKLLLLVLVGNFLGALLITALTYMSGQLDYSSGLLGAYTIKVALGKVNISFAEGIVSGVLCNILVCVAVLMALCAKDITGKLLVCFFVIMLFVTGGFEHCVANMYYISAGLFSLNNPHYVQLAISEYGFSADYINTLTVSGFMIKNLLPVTIGNIIGGSIFVGLPVFYLNCDKKKS